LNGSTVVKISEWQDGALSQTRAGGGFSDLPARTEYVHTGITIILPDNRQYFDRKSGIFIDNEKFGIKEPTVILYKSNRSSTAFLLIALNPY
jgi:hypothetical protein